MFSKLRWLLWLVAIVLVRQFCGADGLRRYAAQHTPVHRTRHRFLSGGDSQSGAGNCSCYFVDLGNVQKTQVKSPQPAIAEHQLVLSEQIQK